MKGFKIISVLLLTVSCGINNALACTDFRIMAKDSTALVTRSMEFALDLKSNIRTSPRGRIFNTTAPDDKPGLSWKAKYGYVFLDGLNVDMAVDGLNEKGLSFGALYLPILAQYQTVPTGQNQQALPYFQIGDWILSNFETVDQVQQALQKIYVFPAKLSGMGGMIFPLHFSVYDASGKGIVIEYIAGKMTVHNNQIGVLTNSPAYNWHLTNLNNYVHLLPQNPNPVVDNGVTFAATGQGFGMVGIPGDISPPSRFIKIATMQRVIVQPNDAVSLVNMAQHLINNVDIPLGLAREPNKGNYTNESTQWVVFKDLTHKVFYYRTYDNLTLRSVDLTKLNFADNSARLKMPIASNAAIQNVSDIFLKSTQ